MTFLGIVLAIFLVMTLIGESPAAEEKKVVGWVENVRLSPGNIVIPAKLDTGANSCSLDASQATTFRRQGQEWIRFEVSTRQGRNITLERPVTRTATIKRHSYESQVRPVIKLGICLGGVYKETEVNLANRQRFKYPMLIGRKFLKGSFLIDTARKFTAEPHCKELPGLE